jgi:hypothetical protein
MEKLLTFPGYDPRTGPHIFPIEPDRDRTVSHIKMARPLPPAIEQYIRTAKPIVGKAQLLIDALGAGEFWGSNVNGDYFPETALQHEGPEYGFQTFMHWAYPFMHHVNKDPARAYGEKVTLSGYDPQMHRVLLIVTVSEEKCRDILADLANGIYWDVSMGCRVPWDECSICKNRARNRGEYCPHLRYQMNKILQDGRRVFAYNWLPKFFDISFVTIGAEKASHVLKKVASHYAGSYEIRGSAEAGEEYYKLAGAKAASTKEADIEKDVPSNISSNIRPTAPEQREQLVDIMDDAGDVKANELELPPQLLDNVAQFPMTDIVSTLAMLGIDLRPQEFQRIVLIKLGHRSLAEQLTTRHLVFDEAKLASPAPSWSRGFDQVDAEKVNEKLAYVLRPYIAERSCYPEILAARLDRFEKKGMQYDRGGQWWKMDSEEQRKSSGMSGLVPASLALAAGFAVFKNAFPKLMEKSPTPIRAIARHPWLLPLLAAAGVGASVSMQHSNAPRQLSPDNGTGRGLDAMGAHVYDGSKTAAIGPVARLGLIPLAYIYAATRARQWEHGAKLNAVDRLIAQRPDLTALATFALTPRVAAGFKRLAKHGSVMGDLAIYTVGSPSKFIPGVLTGALLDSAIFEGIRRLASRKKER